MAGFPPPIYPAQFDAKTKLDEKVDYSKLPCPVPYEDLHREAYSSVLPSLYCLTSLFSVSFRDHHSVFVLGFRILGLLISAFESE